MERIGTVDTPYGLADLLRGTYVSADGPMALTLKGADDGEPIAHASVNIVGVSETLPAGEFCAKVWDMSEELRSALLASPLFEDTGRRVPAGYATAEIWRLKEPVRA